MVAHHDDAAETEPDPPGPGRHAQPEPPDEADGIGRSVYARMIEERLGVDPLEDRAFGLGVQGHREDR